MRPIKWESLDDPKRWTKQSEADDALEESSTESRSAFNEDAHVYGDRGQSQ